MKKVLILSASPRIGGNSDVLCNEFMRGAQEKGHRVEKIYVNQKKIGFCQACYSCKTTGKCFQNDDMMDILEQLIDADVIVLSSPVYFYSMDAQLKTLIDRTLPRYMEIKNKEFYLFATAAASKKAMERTIDSMKGFIDCLPQAVIKKVIYGDHVWHKGEIQDHPAMKEAYQAGKEL